MTSLRTRFGWIAMLLMSLIWIQGSAIGQPKTLSDLPATFVGDLPCADCPGIHYQLDLFADHTFASRMAYEDRNSRFDDHGHWELTDDGKLIVLHSGNKSTQKLAIHDAETLRQLDSNSNEIASKLNYDLKRAPKFSPLPRQVSAEASLEDTVWKLTELGDTTISTDSVQKEPYLSFNSANHRVSGSGGCNRLMGSYEVNGDQLKLSQMAGTRMACVQGMEEENKSLQMLGQVSTWRIKDQHLELFDASGKLIARFAAQRAQ